MQAAKRPAAAGQVLGGIERTCRWGQTCATMNPYTPKIELRKLKQRGGLLPSAEPLEGQHSATFLPHDTAFPLDVDSWDQ